VVKAPSDTARVGAAVLAQRVVLHGGG
jgi:hypothetical protein